MSPQQPWLRNTFLRYLREYGEVFRPTSGSFEPYAKYLVNLKKLDDLLEK